MTRETKMFLTKMPRTQVDPSPLNTNQLNWWDFTAFTTRKTYTPLWKAFQYKSAGPQWSHCCPIFTFVLTPRRTIMAGFYETALAVLLSICTSVYHMCVRIFRFRAETWVNMCFKQIMYSYCYWGYLVLDFWWADLNCQQYNFWVISNSEYSLYFLKLVYRINVSDMIWQWNVTL